MRRFVATMIVCLIAAAVFAGVTKGWGAKVNISSTAVQYSGISVQRLEFLNTGGTDIYVMVSADTNTLMTALSKSTAVCMTNGIGPVPIPAGGKFTFQSIDDKITTFSMVSATNAMTNLVYVGGM